MIMKPYYQDKNCIIYNGDCRDILPQLSKVDLVLTDPPYGIGADKGTDGFGCVSGKKYSDNWDVRPETLDVVLMSGNTVIVFGGNYLTDLLPVNGHWIVWDKTGEVKFKNPFSDCELAWTNVHRKNVKKYICIQQGFIAKEKVRFHPTQKPVRLFIDIISDYSNKHSTILDPFMGSGTTLVAAKQLGRKAIGIEIEEKYCEIAAKRLDAIKFMAEHPEKEKEGFFY